MITKMHIENFKCFKDFDIELGPFNVLIGPNDSGKTAFLKAILSVLDLARCQGTDDVNFDRDVASGVEMVWRKQEELSISFQFTTSERLSFRVEGTRNIGGGYDYRYLQPMDQCSFEALGNAVYYRFDPGALKKPCVKVPPPNSGMAQDGEGLGFLLFTMAKDFPQSFQDLQGDFCRRFSAYQGVDANLVTVNGKREGAVGLFFKTQFGRLFATSVSDGAMVFLAYTAIAHSANHPKVLLVEEPENGVHHGSLKEIVATLKGIADKKGIQVILATHSPYLLDLVEPEEVRVFSKDQEGAVHAVKLSDFPDIQDMKKNFMTGEIWTTFEEADIVAKVRGAK
jgi:predicted ATPase